MELYNFSYNVILLTTLHIQVVTKKIDNLDYLENTLTLFPFNILLYH